MFVPTCTCNVFLGADAPEGGALGASLSSLGTEVAGSSVVEAEGNNQLDQQGKTPVRRNIEKHARW